MDTKVTTASGSTELWEERLGAQVRRARLDRDWTQAQLADRANIALGAVKNLESGRGSTLKSLIRVVRVLGFEEWLGQLNPDPGISPIALLRAQRASEPPRRATGRG